MINQEADKGLKERAADFCLNVMKNNDSIVLTHLVGQDLKSRYFIKNKSLNEQIANEQVIANQTKVGLITASILLEEQNLLEKKFIQLEKQFKEFQELDKIRAKEQFEKIDVFVQENMPIEINKAFERIINKKFEEKFAQKVKL